MSIQGVEPTDYQGINRIGVLSLTGLIQAMKSVGKTWVTFIIEKNVFRYGLSINATLNILFFILEAVVFLVAVVKTKVYKKCFKFVSVIVCIFAIPFAVCMWQFVSPDVVYAYRMLHSIVILYIFGILLFDKYLNSIKSTALAALTVALVINLAVSANIAYYYLDKEYERSYAEAVTLEYAIKQEMVKTNGENKKIAIIGDRTSKVELDQNSEANNVYMFTKMIEKSLLLDSYHTESFLKNILYFDGEFADQKTKTEISLTEEFRHMKPWFESYDIEIIDDTITIKLG